MIQEERSVSVFDEVLLIAAVAHGVAFFAGEAINRGAMNESRIKEEVADVIAKIRFNKPDLGTWGERKAQVQSICMLK